MTSLTPIALASDITVDDRHAETLLVLNSASGLTVTLPAASGSGRKFTFLVGTTVTSNNDIIQVANSTDVMAGQCNMASDDASDVTKAFETTSTSDTITMNGSTKAGIKGDYIILTDAASGLWQVQMFCQGTDTEATPFSAAV